MSNQILLPETKLSVHNEEIIRRSEKGDIILAIPVKDVRAIRIRKSISIFSLMFLAAAGAIGYIALAVAESNILKVVLCVAAILIGAIMLPIFFQTLLVIETDKEKIKIEVSDSWDVVQGFVATVGLKFIRQTR